LPLSSKPEFMVLITTVCLRINTLICSYHPPAWEMVDRAHDCWVNENAAKTVFIYTPNRCIIISGGDDA
jgi:hypothetical protein